MQQHSVDGRSFAALENIGVPQLTTAEQFVVGVCRCWDAFSADPDPTLAWRELAPVFIYMNVTGALCAFDAAFRVVQRHRLRSLHFREVDCVHVGLTEARLLCALACLQRADPRAATGALSGALSRTGIHALLAPLARIAAMLDTQHHRLPAWRDLPAMTVNRGGTESRWSTTRALGLAGKRLQTQDA